MLQLHVFTASHEKGYSYHHTTNVEFDSEEKLLLACMDVLRNLHKLLAVEIVTVIMENKTMEVNGLSKSGIMITSGDLPYSCFAEGPVLDSDKPLMFSPSIDGPNRVVEINLC